MKVINTKEVVIVMILGLIYADEAMQTTLNTGISYGHNLPKWHW